MLAELIDKISLLSRQAYGLQTYSDDALPEKVFVRHGTELKVHDVPPKRRKHCVHGYDDVLAAVQDEKLVAGDGVPEVWHDHEAIYVFPDRDDRRDMVVLETVVSKRFQTLKGLQSSFKGTVKDVIRMLRFDLHGTGIEEVIRAISKLDFTRRSDGSTHVEHGKESMGKSVEAAVQQADTIPEDFLVAAPVYMNPGLRADTGCTVRCGIYIDVSAELIEVRVLADEITAAVHAAQANIGRKLRKDLGADVAIFHGDPTP